jgi:hypothetical protein
MQAMTKHLVFAPRSPLCLLLYGVTFLLPISGPEVTQRLPRVRPWVDARGPENNFPR